MSEWGRGREEERERERGRKLIKERACVGEGELEKEKLDCLSFETSSVHKRMWVDCNVLVF